MARDAGELPFRRREAATLAQVHGLVANVPGVRPVCRRACRYRHSVTRAATVVELGCACLLQADDVLLRRILGMSGGGSMTSLAPDSEFERLNGTSRSQIQGSGRMALKAAEDLRAGTQCSIGDAGSTLVTRSGCERVGLAIPTEAMLDVSVLPGLTDEGTSLGSGSKGPLRRNRRGGSRSG
jgi:hypothetical protein